MHWICIAWFGTLSLASNEDSFTDYLKNILLSRAKIGSAVDPGLTVSGKTEVAFGTEKDPFVSNIYELTVLGLNKSRIENWDPQKLTFKHEFPLFDVFCEDGKLINVEWTDNGPFHLHLRTLSLEYPSGQYNYDYSVVHFSSEYNLDDYKYESINGLFSEENERNKFIVPIMNRTFFVLDGIYKEAILLYSANKSLPPKDL